jgi:hypothetical protein
MSTRKIIRKDSPPAGLSYQERDLLKSQSAIVDMNQDPSDSPEHGGMRNGLTDQSASQAQQQEDDFIANNEHDAQQLQADWEASGHIGICPAALTAFGNALHAITDAQSPAHKGNQPWYGTKGIWNKLRAAVHFGREAVPSGPDLIKSVDAAQQAWWQTFGHEFDRPIWNLQPVDQPCTWDAKTNTLHCP